MKWWQASAAVVLYFAAFAALEVGWHWYIATGLPLAAIMRGVYLSNSQGHYNINWLPDSLFPLFALTAGIGFIGRRQRLAFALIHGVLAGIGATAIMSLYTRWLHAPPPPARWPLYPEGWRIMSTSYPWVNLVVIPFGAASCQNGFRRNASKKENSKQSSSAGGVRYNGGPPPRAREKQPDTYNGSENQPQVYTARQAGAIILTMCEKGWSVEDAARNFRISPEELRERWRDFTTQCTPEQLSFVVRAMREHSWSIEKTARRFGITEEKLRDQLDKMGPPPVAQKPSLRPARPKMPFYSDREAAAKLNISPAQLMELARAHKLREFRDGNLLFFKCDDIDAIAAGKPAPGEGQQHHL